MKRAPVVLSATALGLAATLGFHPHTTAAPASARTSTSAPATTSPAPSSSSSSATKTVTSDVASNQYGNVQLKVTVSAGKVTKIEAIQLPANDPKSQQINASAEPQLRSEALAAQSASIDAVSGATYTSESYKTALQSALDKAGLAA